MEVKYDAGIYFIKNGQACFAIVKNIYIIMLDNNNNFIIAYNYISMAFLYTICTLDKPCQKAFFCTLTTLYCYRVFGSHLTQWTFNFNWS